MQRVAFGALRKARIQQVACVRANTVRTRSTGSRSILSAPRAYSSNATNAQPKLNSEQSNGFTTNLPECIQEDKKVHVSWDPWTSSRFQHVWLRDHCRCPECFHQGTKQRLVDTFAIPPDIQPSEVEPTIEGLKVTWPSSQPHISLYPWDWLKSSSYDPPVPNRDSHLSSRRREKVLWGAGIVQDPPTVEFEQVMNDERELWKWLSKIDTFGFCFITGVPATLEDTERLSRKLGDIRRTHYGEFWHFTADMAKGDTAYTNMALPAHTDSTYFTDPCGLQLFHLLFHTDGTGGSTLLVDGFYVASILKDLHPEAYRVLSTVRVPTHAAGDSTIMYRPTPSAGYPILVHEGVGGLTGEGTSGDLGDLVQVRYNNDDRSVMKGVSAEVMEQWYDALRKWDKLLKGQDSEYWVQLAPGTAVVVDNHRVLHGRSAFDGKRRMCGSYTGIDDYRSRLSVLTEKYADRPEVSETKERSVWTSWF